jgi:hypothetical protein
MSNLDQGAAALAAAKVNAVKAGEEGIKKEQEFAPVLFEQTMKAFGLTQGASDDTKPEQQDLIDSIEREGSKTKVTAPHARAIEAGASGHEITPRDDSEHNFLKFQPSGSNEWVQVKKVEHPGNNPFNYLDTAAALSAERVEEIAGDDINAAIREAGFTQKS